MGHKALCDIAGYLGQPGCEGTQGYRYWLGGPQGPNTLFERAAELEYTGLGDMDAHGAGILVAPGEGVAGGKEVADVRVGWLMCEWGS